MTLDRDKARWALAALPGVRPNPSPAYTIHRCESYPYTVICAKNESPGGPIGCFDTLCDAA